jgi:hypothetical protein
MVPGAIITSGIAVPLAQIHSITIIEIWFLGIPTYISIIPTGTTISCPAGHTSRVPFSSILYIYLALLILVYLSIGRYSSLNHLRSLDEVYISTRWLIIGFVLIICSIVVVLSQF